ncbi:dolichyl-phosphate beta-glucosyltransferase [Parasteatoda tepidariorum]|uniref:dolichyl-phosphate beta-glucosyltransferase n=1 Tax=Parasteatoda tepidariorum TaxID=114398 RepID=UPI00077FBF6A|nr:dolichyl-phosphate beta-glucosyltransferase [Parasteatoda tepidariorum]
MLLFSTDMIIFMISFIVIFVILFIFRKLTRNNMPAIIRYDEEKYYMDFSSAVPTKKPFPGLFDEYSLYLSVIVPAYNEQDRLPPMLDECMEFLENRSRRDRQFSYEVIIVDDGSLDKTSEIGLEYSKKYGSDKCRVLTLVKNRGKGGAVRLGMLYARGRYLLFADADGATKFEDFEKLESEMRQSTVENIYSIVVGSRAHLEKEAIASRSFFRTILMYGFHFLVWLFAVRSVRDTQCGFKMFTREAGIILFAILHVERWAFDVELLYIAEKKTMAIKEVAVNWTEIDGSKLVPFWSWLQMGIDLLMIWIKYQTGIWKLQDTKKFS